MAKRGACVWGRLLPACVSLEIGGLPIGLANHSQTLTRDVPLGQSVTWNDVQMDETDDAYCYRREMETHASLGQQENTHEVGAVRFKLDKPTSSSGSSVLQAATHGGAPREDLVVARWQQWLVR